MMFTIKSPVKGYSGSGFGMHFANGEATTDNERVAMRLKKMGYIVSSDTESKQEPGADEQKGKNKQTGKSKGKQKPGAEPVQESEQEPDKEPEQEEQEPEQGPEG